ncbi:MAG: cupin domain-containing protein [Thermodesulfovibrionales bacterium]|nr:cupin domain-containing protein [Thermodesulfovibrionales bacterium]
MARKTPVSCDWSIGAALKGKKPHKENKSALYKHKGKFRWQGIKIEKYKQSSGGWADIARQTLIGNKGETAKFHLRYFEIVPGGHSSLETHKHEHVVICVRGKGKAIAGKKGHILNFLDTLYISPDTPHQLRNPFKSPFGFLCIVNAKRDKPKLLSA